MQKSSSQSSGVKLKFTTLLPIFILIILLILIAKNMVFNDSSPDYSETESIGTANCEYGDLEPMYRISNNGASIKYFFQTTIKNKGDAEAKSVCVYYYYYDIAKDRRYDKMTYLGSIPAGSSIEFQSDLTSIDFFCYEGVYNFGISKITWR